jgi:hypothetical protein
MIPVRMSDRWLDRCLRLGSVYLLSVLFCASLWALQRALKSKIHNYPNAPVELKRPQITLVETFATPTQTRGPDAGARKSRVRYANREGLSPSSFVLSGEVICTNKSSQVVEALALTIVALDAFHQPVQLPGQRAAYLVQQVLETLPRGASKRIAWEQPITSSDVYEVAMVVTRVRFSDGSVWFAPGEELIDIF